MPYSESDKIKKYASVDPIIIAGAIGLAFNAGFVNAISLCYFHVPVSHMTGAVANLSIDMASLNFKEFIYVAYIFFGFLLGAVTSGFLIGSKNFRFSMQNVIVLIIESCTLFISYLLLNSAASFGLFFAAFSCGLQNAMGSSYLGLIIRTTHLTGIVTDLGVLIGHSIKEKKIRFWKIAFFSFVLLGFFSGGMIAVLLFKYLSYSAILIPVFICATGALALYFLRIKK